MNPVYWLTAAQWEAAGLTCFMFGSLILGVLFVIDLFLDAQQRRDDEAMRAFYRRREAVWGRVSADVPERPFDQETAA